MNNTLKTILLGALGGVVVLLLSLGFGVDRKLGGLIHNIQESFDEGIAVDGTERISGTGGASVATGTFSNSLTVTGETNIQELIQGGGILTETAGTSTTWSAADICDYSVINWAPGAARSTTTVAQATDIVADCLTEDGDYKDIVYWNTGLTASTSIFAMSTGTTMYIPSATAATSTIAGLNLAEIRFVRASSTAVYMFLKSQAVQ